MTSSSALTRAYRRFLLRIPVIGDWYWRRLVSRTAHSESPFTKVIRDNKHNTKEKYDGRSWRAF
jgi:hypothetical protein